MESQSLTLDEIQQLKNELQENISELLLAFTQKTGMRVIEVRPYPDGSGRGFRFAPRSYEARVILAYPFQ